MKEKEGSMVSRLRFLADGFGAVAMGAGGACLVGFVLFGYMDERIVRIGTVAVLISGWLLAVGNYGAGVRNGQSESGEDEAAEVAKAIDVVA